MKSSRVVTEIEIEFRQESRLDKLICKRRG